MLSMKWNSFGPSLEMRLHHAGTLTARLIYFHPTRVVAPICIFYHLSTLSSVYEQP